MSPRSLVFAALVVAACGDRTAAPELTYPRLASYFIETTIDDAAAEVMARSDLVVVDAEAAARGRGPLDAIHRDHPDTLILAYLTSEEIARSPSAEQPLAAARFSRIPPASWLVEPGSTLIEAVGPAATQLRVANPAAFTVARPGSAFYLHDEPTYVLVDGEHMRLVSIAGDVLTVERGYRSSPVPHAAGAPIASHVVFFAGTWMLNIAANAPTTEGRTWRDELADEAAGLVAKGPWTGVFLDVCFSDIAWLNGGLLDLDRDGRSDDRTKVSGQWSMGMGMLVDTLRSKLGSDVPIIANPGAQDCPHQALDGILMEGWPTGMPAPYLDFALGQQRYTRWAQSGRHLTIANAFSPKIGFGTIAAGQDAVARTDYRAMRFGLAVTLMGDGYYAFDNGVFGHYVAWWYDEYDGVGRGAHWLGRARGAAHSQGTVRWREFEHGLAVVNLGTTPATFVAPRGFAKLAGTQDPEHNDGGPVGATLSIGATDGFLLHRR